jgi:hypothetical protein
MRFLLALAAGALGYCYYRGREARERHVATKEDVHRWEGEGGNVPAVATPSPAPTPQSSYPAGDAAMRH